MIECSYTDSDPIWMAVQKQVARLQGLPKFPAGSEAKRELCLALAHANSIAEAMFIVDRVVQSDSTEHCPSPPDIRRMINAEHDRGRVTSDEIESEWIRQDSNYRCAKCQDFGITETIQRSLKSVAAYCACPAGVGRRQLREDKYSPDIVNLSRAKLLSRFPDQDILGLIAAAARQRQMGTA